MNPIKKKTRIAKKAPIGVIDIPSPALRLTIVLFASSDLERCPYWFVVEGFG